MPNWQLRLRFRGVRGSTPTPQPENLQFGGNTACVEVLTRSGTRLIFDAGTGIRGLGRDMVREAAGAPIDARIFLTHFHWDHIQGLPFFAPIYGAANAVTYYSRLTEAGLREALEGQMARPYYPIALCQAAARREFRELGEGPFHGVDDVTILPFPLNHPQGANGYRIECGNAVLVYASDYEPGDEGLDEALLRYARDADVLICDAQFTPKEYEARRGWGHGTWLAATALARRAGAKRLVLFHHDPDHDDRAMAEIETMAQAEFADCVAAREGMTIEI